MIKQIFSLLIVCMSVLVLFSCGKSEEITTEATTEDETTTEIETSETAENKIIVKVDGEEKNINSSASTVGEFLTVSNIALGENDIVEPEKDEALTDGMTIVIKRVTKKNVTETKEIPFKTQKKNSEAMPEGTTKTEKQGVNGQKEIVYSVTYEDGVETDRKVVSETVIVEPVDAVVVYGTAAAEKTTAAPNTTQQSPETTKPAPTTTAAAPARPTPDLSGYDKSQIASIEAVDDCDGSGHGYFMITFVDGHVEYQDY